MQNTLKFISYESNNFHLRWHRLWFLVFMMTCSIVFSFVIISIVFYIFKKFYLLLFQFLFMPTALGQLLKK